MSSDLSRMGRSDLETAFLILRDESRTRNEEIKLLRADREALMLENIRWIHIIKKYERRFAAMARIMTGKGNDHAEVAPGTD